MHRLIRAVRRPGRNLTLCLALAACAAAPPPGNLPVFRQPEVPIYSSAALDLTRLEGAWTQAATFSAGAGPGCPPGGVVFERRGRGLQVAGKLCLAGRRVAVNGPVTPTGPGRFTVPGLGEWWVVWVDVGYRTLAVGTPSGVWGFVLDRGRLPPDRLTAAREVLDFNGYDATRLQPY